ITTKTSFNHKVAGLSYTGGQKPYKDQGRGMLPLSNWKFLSIIPFIRKLLCDK
ncbi:16294_t:CDS:1, partial [Cetraspora pellucida]